MQRNIRFFDHRGGALAVPSLFVLEVQYQLSDNNISKAEIFNLHCQSDKPDFGCSYNFDNIHHNSDYDHLVIKNISDYFNGNINSGHDHGDPNYGKDDLSKPDIFHIYLDKNYPNFEHDDDLTYTSHLVYNDYINSKPDSKDHHYFDVDQPYTFF
ncbi:unnamed protein product [Caenorhabditis auriculariae]|uniref:Uncharacterized protein n=1 Tax=Caenorhabditis auriculariae TaxID=2777116 RepID=A0A8S1H7E7_9PELO|nr:unnamed protein product [Caenorhabditis auriculariae]